MPFENMCRLEKNFIELCEKQKKINKWWARLFLVHSFPLVFSADSLAPGHALSIGAEIGTISDDGIKYC